MIVLTGPSTRAERTPASALPAVVIGIAFALTACASETSDGGPGSAPPPPSPPPPPAPDPEPQPGMLRWADAGDTGGFSSLAVQSDGSVLVLTTNREEPITEYAEDGTSVGSIPATDLGTAGLSPSRIAVDEDDFVYLFGYSEDGRWLSLYDADLSPLSHAPVLADYPRLNVRSAVARRGVGVVVGGSERDRFDDHPVVAVLDPGGGELWARWGFDDHEEDVDAVVWDVALSDDGRRLAVAGDTRGLPFVEVLDQGRGPSEWHRAWRVVDFADIRFSGPALGVAFRASGDLVVVGAATRPDGTGWVAELQGADGGVVDTNPFKYQGWHTELLDVLVTEGDVAVAVGAILFFNKRALAVALPYTDPANPGAAVDAGQPLFAPGWAYEGPAYSTMRQVLAQPNGDVIMGGAQSESSGHLPSMFLLRSYLP